MSIMLPKEWDQFTKVARAVIPDKDIAELVIDFALDAAMCIGDQRAKNTRRVLEKQLEKAYVPPQPETD